MSAPELGDKKFLVNELVFFYLEQSFYITTMYLLVK
jgi:hypothetical protein